ncbi:MAG: hypothetical protein AB1390_10755 [Nitrospirota bacterium]
MRKVLLMATALVFLLQTGCTKAIRYTEEEIKDFPQNIQEHIRQGEISLGMTPKQVRYAWGSPESIKVLEPYEGKSREEWIYSTMGTLGVVGTRLLLFLDGKLIYIK